MVTYCGKMQQKAVGILPALPLSLYFNRSQIYHIPFLYDLCFASVVLFLPFRINWLWADIPTGMFPQIIICLRKHVGIFHLCCLRIWFWYPQC